MALLTNGTDYMGVAAVRRTEIAMVKVVPLLSSLSSEMRPPFARRKA